MQVALPSICWLYRLCRSRRFRFLCLHLADETHALSGYGTDEALVLSRVVEGASNGIDAGRQCRLRDDPPLPDCSIQIVLADNPMAVFNQVFGEIENLRCDGNRLRLPAQLAAVRVERKVCESIPVAYTGAS